MFFSCVFFVFYSAKERYDVDDANRIQGSKEDNNVGAAALERERQAGRQVGNVSI